MNRRDVLGHIGATAVASFAAIPQPDERDDKIAWLSRTVAAFREELEEADMYGWCMLQQMTKTRTFPAGCPPMICHVSSYPDKGSDDLHYLYEMWQRENGEAACPTSQKPS